MLTFDDLLAARILSRLAPRLRAELLILLDDRRKGILLRDVLTTLRERELLDVEQSHHVRQAMARYKRGRALGLYVRLLAAEGVLNYDRLVERARRLGPETTAVQLGASLLEEGLLEPEQDERLRFRARVAFDSDMQRQMDEHLARTTGPPPGQDQFFETARFNSLAQLPVVQSAIFRLDTPVPTPTSEESEEILESSGPTLGDLQPPSFPVPEWVDTSVLSCDRLLIGDYRVLGRLGVGGAATVYLVHALADSSRATALKVLRADAPPETIARFKREALAGSLFSSPWVLDLYEAGEDDGLHFLAMEFFDGRPLDRVVDGRPEGIGLEAAVNLVCQLLEGLVAVHAAHVVHRDIKPANILVSDDLSDLRLTDFGISHVGHLGELDDRVFHTQGRKLIGTPRYMAPEQISGDALDDRTDLYAVGLVLYELLAGRSPFDAEEPLGFLSCHMQEAPTPLQQVARVPAPLADLVHRLLAKDPDGRPSSAAAVLEALRPLGSGGAP